MNNEIEIILKIENDTQCECCSEQIITDLTRVLVVKADTFDGEHVAIQFCSFSCLLKDIQEEKFLTMSMGDEY